ncbi:uncharacterized protein LACBIDRAFT_334109 [Laccaria bicolor S238N-H82]|uniref:Predicted protein n=1 Tax=Laccaria bicolor (strain S238N-H82 / ATCC MYA-4686) TaxID=486041 RepID=B0DY41_LACBS|nr:uncharacterized protein LACBIDRAFT_334109 [Laccaria bicolor S238N-H82]EDR00497.1 predicted protein [Laccaria bicolor S238N-H82]|eukprot:XP_001888889.1 predicted protein [Laccaria bicolor S238N-H82]
MPTTRATTKSTSVATSTARKRQGSAADQTPKKRLRSNSKKKASKADLEPRHGGKKGKDVVLNKGKNELPKFPFLDMYPESDNSQLEMNQWGMTKTSPKPIEKTMKEKVQGRGEVCRALYERMLSWSPLAPNPNSVIIIVITSSMPSLSGVSLTSTDPMLTHAAPADVPLSRLVTTEYLYGSAAQSSSCAEQPPSPVLSDSDVEGTLQRVETTLLGLQCASITQQEKTQIGILNLLKNCIHSLDTAAFVCLSLLCPPILSPLPSRSLAPQAALFNSSTLLYGLSALTTALPAALRAS